MGAWAEIGGVRSGYVDWEDPCWTGADAPVVCSRGGIGCPKPHDGGPVPSMPDEFMWGEPSCDKHGSANCYGPVCECMRCSRWQRFLQRHALVGWARTRRQARNAKRRAYKRWHRELEAMR